MARATTTTANGNGQAPATLDRPRLELPNERQRRPLRAVALLIVAGACAGGFAVLFTQAGDRESVLAMARTVRAGTVITAEDLTVARVSADSKVQPLPSSARSRVEGRTANYTLVEGTLLTQAQLGAPVGPGPDESVVGLLLKGTRVAPGGLRQGDRVEIILTVSATEGARADSASAGTSTPLGRVLAEGRVLADPTKGTGDSMVVSVVVSDALAPAVAGAAASDRIAVVRLGSTP